VLRVGLTGGIGSGKSTVAARLVERGAVLVDSDRIAREVVAAGTPGLAAVVDAFGPAMLAADGSLDRPALAAVVFDDPVARKKLNGIVHPLVRRRSDELIAAAPADSIVVQDIPL
jgi:dephospho-CoA kinase